MSLRPEVSLTSLPAARPPPSPTIYLSISTLTADRLVPQAVRWCGTGNWQLVTKLADWIWTALTEPGLPEQYV